VAAAAGAAPISAALAAAAGAAAVPQSRPVQRKKAAGRQLAATEGIADIAAYSRLKVRGAEHHIRPEKQHCQPRQIDTAVVRMRFSLTAWAIQES